MFDTSQIPADHLSVIKARERARAAQAEADLAADAEVQLALDEGLRFYYFPITRQVTRYGKVELQSFRVTACYHTLGNTLYVGYAFCSPKDQFRKGGEGGGRYRSLVRLEKAPIVIEIPYLGLEKEISWDRIKMHLKTLAHLHPSCPGSH